MVSSVKGINLFHKRKNKARYLMHINISKTSVKRMVHGSFQWCPVAGQGAMAINQTMRSCTSTWGRAPWRWMWRSTEQSAQGGCGVSLAGDIPNYLCHFLQGTLPWQGDYTGLSPEVPCNTSDGVSLWSDSVAVTHHLLCASWSTQVSEQKIANPPKPPCFLSYCWACCYVIWKSS